MLLPDGWEEPVSFLLPEEGVGWCNFRASLSRRNSCWSVVDGGFVVHADVHTLDDLKHSYGPPRCADHVTRATLYSLLDVGTGSVIQPVASAMSGAKKVMGMDSDPASGQRVVVMANLQSDALVRDPALLAGLVKPGGRLFGGGILDIKADHTIIALEEQGKK